jgi:flagellar biosynthesis/type III secretory pathway protein FliH
MEKFSFDLVFSEDGSASTPNPRPKRSYRADEVEVIRKECFAAGEQSELARIEAAAARSVDELATGVHEVLSTLRMETERIRDDSTRLAARIARKFVSHMIGDAPELYLERCIEECLDVLHEEPEITIIIPKDSAPSLKTRLVQMAEGRGFGAGLRIEESPSLNQTSCRLNWRKGGAEISLEDALAAMDRIIEEHIASLHGTGLEEAQAESA